MPKSLAAVNEWLSAYGLNAPVLSSFRLDPFRYNRVEREHNIGPPIFGSLAKIVPAANLPLPTNPHLATSPGRSSSRSPNKLAVSSSICQFAKWVDPNSKKDNRDVGTNPQPRGQADTKAVVTTDLDVQYTVSLASGVPAFFISVRDHDQVWRSSTAATTTTAILENCWTSSTSWAATVLSYRPLPPATDGKKLPISRVGQVRISFNPASYQTRCLACCNGYAYLTPEGDGIHLFNWQRRWVVV
ncbi:hypothetical protein EDB86DRAFT_2837129 [Lactarius hatsudake]|nr:hypothetical protein EDB86DRAFT_2837129 [Lactarius hatsudake]